MTDKLYWYWFSALSGISSVKQHQLMEIFCHPRELFLVKPNIIEEKFSKSQLETFIKTRNISFIQEQYEQLEKQEIICTMFQEATYPSRLKKIYDFPYVFFQKGQPYKEKSLNIAIVGTMFPTSYGIEIARRFAKELASYNVGVISGLAKGIDGAAHRGAMSQTGMTTGILGCGIDKIYPKDNYQLFHEMYLTQTVLSEYPPGVPPYSWNFPKRNRLISGLSDGVVVVEAEKKSGSLITADCGLEQNKEIFAVPGPVTQKKHEGCHRLIKEGAKLTESVEDILTEFPDFTKCSGNFSQFMGKCLAVTEKKVYDVLDLYPKHLNEIVYLSGLSFEKTLEVLFHLESDGYVKQVHHNIYIRCEMPTV